MRLVHIHRRMRKNDIRFLDPRENQIVKMSKIIERTGFIQMLLTNLRTTTHRDARIMEGGAQRIPAACGSRIRPP